MEEKKSVRFTDFRLHKTIYVAIIFLWLIPSFSAEAGQIIYVDSARRIIHVETTTSRAKMFAQGDQVVVKLRNPPIKKLGEIKAVRGHRIIVKISGLLNYLQPRMRVTLKKRVFTKKNGNRAIIINRKSYDYRSRRNFSLMGSGAFSFSDQILLYGGGVGVSIPFNIEIEAHGLLGSTLTKTASVQVTYMTGHIKKFFGNYFHIYTGGGVRSYTITQKGVRPDQTPSEEGEVRPSQQQENGEPQAGTIAENYSDDVIAELGAGVRIQVRTLVLGRGFIIGIDVGYWALISEIDQSAVLDSVLDKEFPLPTSSVFARANIGFGF